MRSLLLENEIYVRLTPVHKRQQTRAFFGGLVRGLWGGAAAAVLLGLANLALLKWPVHRTYQPQLAEWPHHWAVLPGAGVGPVRGSRHRRLFSGRGSVARGRF